VNATTVAGSSILGGGSTSQTLQYPTDVFIDTIGAIYVADSSNYRVQKWLPGASNGTTVVPGSSGTGLNQFNSSKQCFFFFIHLYQSLVF
jgi:hypothetical protein